MYHPFIIGEKIYFRCMEEADAEGPYLDWMNDEEVTRFLTTVGRFPYTKAHALDYIQSMAQSDKDVFFAIHDIKTDELIGTAHFGPINWLHRTGTCGDIIGNKEYWGKGYGTEICFLLTEYGFRRLNLHKITVGTIGEQTPVLKYVKKLGYIQEAVHREQFFHEGRYLDGYEFGMIDREFFNGPYGKGWPKTSDRET